MDKLRDSVNFTIDREINNPGKLNYKDGYLFISETKKGIHIIDNRNLNNPINIGFINLPGNNDIATKNVKGVNLTIVFGRLKIEYKKNIEKECPSSVTRSKKFTA